MDYASAKIRAFVRTLAEDPNNGAIQQMGQTIDRAIIGSLQLAWCDAVRDEWDHFCEVSPAVKESVAIGKELMREAGYTEGDPVCLPLGMEPNYAMVDGRKAFSIEHSMPAATPLSVIYANKVREVLDAKEKVAATQPQALGTILSTEPPAPQ